MKNLIEECREEVLARFGVCPRRRITEADRARAQNYDLQGEIERVNLQIKQEKIEKMKDELERELPAKKDDKENSLKI